MDSEENIHKKPRMDEEKETVEDVEPIKVVSLLQLSDVIEYFIHR